MLCFSRSLPRSSRPLPHRRLRQPSDRKSRTSSRATAALESAARTARTTYVVTAAQIAAKGDRTVADAHRRRSRRQRRSLRRLRRREHGRDSWQLVGANPGAGRRTADGRRSDQRRQSRAASGRGSRSHRSRRGRRLDALRFRIDRRRHQHHHGSAAQSSTATLSTGSFNEQTYLFQTPYLTFQRTYATNDYSVVNAPNRQNAQAGLTAVSARYSHSLGALDLTLCWRSRRRTRGRARRARILLTDERAEQSSIATCA